MARITKKKFKQACIGSGGVGSVVARSIGVDRTAIYHYLKKHPEMRKFLDEEGEKIIDVAEHNVDKEIIAGNIDVSQWALINRKKGKARGYGPRQQLEHEGKIFDFTISREDNGKKKDTPKDERQTTDSVGHSRG